MNLLSTSLMRCDDYAKHCRLEYKETATWIWPTYRRSVRLGISRTVYREEKELDNSKSYV
jgi:hypothetical protein